MNATTIIGLDILEKIAFFQTNGLIRLFNNPRKKITKRKLIKRQKWNIKQYTKLSKSGCKQ